MSVSWLHIGSSWCMLRCRIHLGFWHAGLLMIDLIASLSVLILILAWLFWSLHMHTLTIAYHSAWHIDSLTCILFWIVFEHDVCITICLDCRILAYLVCTWVVYPALPDCMMHDCPPSAWLHVVCLCGSHFYPPTSNSLGFGHSFHLGSVCLLSDRARD